MKNNIIFLVFCFCTTNFHAQTASSNADQLLASVSGRFEENKGQIWDMENQPAHDVQYHYTQGNTHLFMLSTGIAYQFNKIHYPEDYQHDTKRLSPEEHEKNDQLCADIRLETYRMDMRLVGANPSAKIVAEGMSTDYTQYYNRNAIDVHSFTKLTYQNIYPHIDWVIYSQAQGIKYDFVVHSGGNPADIRLQFSHHESLVLHADGSFTATNSMGYIREQAPVSLQADRIIPTRFVRKGEDILAFELDKYDTNSTLVIDPSLIWATYYGGANADNSNGCAVDGFGNVYLAGTATSNTNIASGGHQNTFGGDYDAFLVKFNNNGVRQWATYYGDGADDRGQNCAADNNGNVYLVGYTQGGNNITFNGHQTTFGGGVLDAFLVKFTSDGVRQWATYYGGTNGDYGQDCTTDSNGNVFLVGRTSSLYLASNGHQNTLSGLMDAFLVKFASSGVRLWATYYGGSAGERGESCATDGNGNIYLTGYTQATNDIAFSGHQNTLGGDLDAFLVKFNSSGVRQWGTYYGGIADEHGYDCATDGNGNVYLVGYTYSTTNIASNGHQDTFSGWNDAFLVKFDASGVRQWATYYGGNGPEEARSCLTDSNNNVYLIGSTASAAGISLSGYQNTLGGNFDAFLVKFNSSGVRQWGTYYGGTGGDYGYGGAIDDNGNVYLTGYTSSSTNIAFGGHQTTYAGGTLDAFLAKFSTKLETGIPLTTTSNALLSLYPNPTTGQINLTWESAIPITELEVFSILGQRLIHQTIGSKQQSVQLDLPYAAGIYFLSLHNEQGQLHSLKIEKQ